MTRVRRLRSLYDALEVGAAAIDPSDPNVVKFRAEQRLIVQAMLTEHRERRERTDMAELRRTVSELRRLVISDEGSASLGEAPAPRRGTAPH